MKLPAPVADTIQATLNHYIALDPEASPKIAALAGKLVQIHVDAINIDLYLLFHADYIEVLELFPDPGDVCISGTPLSLLSVANGRKTIHDGGVAITGDVRLAQQFSRLIGQLDIDWDEHLSKITGDTAAHHIGRTLRRFRGWMTRSRSTLQSNTADYLRDETNHLPHDWEIDEFSDSVDELRDRVELLEIKIRQQSSDAGKR